MASVVAESRALPEQDWAEVLGRVALAAIFLWSAYGKFADIASNVGYMKAYGMPMAELLHWQAAGLSPQQIIEASTRGSALAVGLEAELGTVEVGKVADLLVVQGDPLADLSALARPLLVVHDGQIVDP